MRLGSVLAALALRGVGLVASQETTVTPAPSNSFAPTPAPGSEYCAPACEYNYRYTPREINKKLIKVFIQVILTGVIFFTGNSIFTSLMLLGQEPGESACDLLQVAVFTKSRLDAIAGFSGQLIGFIAFVID